MNWSGKMLTKYVQVLSLFLFHIHYERIYMSIYAFMLNVGNGVDLLMKMIVEFDVSGCMFDLQYRAAGLALRFGRYSPIVYNLVIFL